MDAFLRFKFIILKSFFCVKRKKAPFFGIGKTFPVFSIFLRKILKGAAFCDMLRIVKKKKGERS